MDGCISRRGTISSSQSAATSKIVKHCCSRVFSSKQRYIKCPCFTFTFTFLQPVNCVKSSTPVIKAGETPLLAVDKVCYLDSILSSDANIGDDIDDDKKKT